MQNMQCLGSGAVGSARFWLPGFGSKGQNINQKLQKKAFLLLKLKSELLKKERL